MSARTGIYDEASVGHPATRARLYEAIRTANKINLPRVSDRTMGKSKLGKNPSISQPGGNQAIGDLQSRASCHDERMLLAPLATPRRGVPGSLGTWKVDAREIPRRGASSATRQGRHKDLPLCHWCAWREAVGHSFLPRATRATRHQISIQPPRCVFILTVSVQAARARSESKQCKRPVVTDNSLNQVG